jgi:predicted nucleic acid-binding protein
VKDYVLDANAVLLYFGVGKAEGGEKVRSLFAEAERRKAHLYMSAVNLGEVVYILLKHIDEPSMLRYIHALQHAVTIVEAGTERTLDAARLKHQYKLGYADSFAAALALELRATLVSADPEFDKIGKSLKWMKLPKFMPKRST